MGEAEKRLHRCCFTGHRPEKLNATEEEVKAWLEMQIDRAIADGFVTFISGCAMGVDLWACEIVLRKKAEDTTLHMIAATSCADSRSRRPLKTQFPARKRLNSRPKSVIMGGQKNVGKHCMVICILLFWWICHCSGPA